MATPRNSVEHRFRVVDYGRYPLFLRRFWLNLVPFQPDPNRGTGIGGRCWRPLYSEV